MQSRRLCQISRSLLPANHCNGDTARHLGLHGSPLSSVAVRGQSGTARESTQTAAHLGPWGEQILRNLELGIILFYPALLCTVVVAVVGAGETQEEMPSP